MGTVNPDLQSQLVDIRKADIKVIESFFNDEISLDKADYNDETEYDLTMRSVLGLLSSYSTQQIVDILKVNYSPKEVSTGTIPQYSDLTVALYNCTEILNKLDKTNISFEEMGGFLWPTERKRSADLKYGENHAKTAALIALTSVKNGKINITDFGKLFLSFNPAQQAILIPILWLRVPLFYNFFCSDKNEDVLKKDIAILAETTQKRRLSNIRTIIDIIEKGYFLPEQKLGTVIEIETGSDSTSVDYLRAMRTKPFLLLAGISGTGKSRIVKQMAFDSCPDNETLRADLTSPGNYCLIEVKPNWHDSTELLGYESKIGGAHYQLTPFVKFLAKAMLYPDVPFFVCLDEMNLAPVEQYFAEFLSVLESRTKIDGHIVSEPLIKADIFKKYALEKSLFSKEEEISRDYSATTIEPIPPYGKEAEVYEQLKQQGLRIPENVIVIGTVNMDETTHQFSRKVIDRAMTIEMNLPVGDPFMDFFANASELEYRTAPTDRSLYLPTETKASEVVKALAGINAEKTEWLKGEVAKLLTAINTALEGTPFKIAYRVQNELMLYFYQLWLEDKPDEWETLLNTAVDQILMMKVLPRVEGDEELLEKPLDRLIEFAASYSNATKKLAEMKSRLGQSQFTSFWP